MADALIDSPTHFPDSGQITGNTEVMPRTGQPGSLIMGRVFTTSTEFNSCVRYAMRRLTHTHIRAGTRVDPISYPYPTIY
jgi:hypothetical protein